MPCSLSAFLADRVLYDVTNNAMASAAMCEATTTAINQAFKSSKARALRTYICEA